MGESGGGGMLVPSVREKDTGVSWGSWKEPFLAGMVATLAFFCSARSGKKNPDARFIREDYRNGRFRRRKKRMQVQSRQPLLLWELVALEFGIALWLVRRTLVGVCCGAVREPARYIRSGFLRSSVARY